MHNARYICMSPVNNTFHNQKNARIGIIEVYDKYNLYVCVFADKHTNLNASI